jgi:Lon protease-like protein
MLPPLIPLFPLPNVVLFPNVFLPLHIFEPRYRAMVSDALAGDRIIGMVLLQPGSRSDYEGRPAVYPIGTAGVITHSEALPDGRFHIVLRGIEKFRIAEEDQTRVYRLARVEPLPDNVAPTDRDALRHERRRLEAVLGDMVERDAAMRAGSDPQFPPSISDEDLVNGLAQYLALEPIERQALLERDGILARARGLSELLEIKMLASGAPGDGRSVH